MNINEKAAYLQGLLDGLKLDTSLPENKLLTQIVSIVGDMAEVIDDIKEETEVINEVIDELDITLERLESYVYEDEDEDDLADILSLDYDEDDLDDEYEDDEE